MNLFRSDFIPQVHRAVALDGTELAIKIQYPGVAKSIESDIDNLIGMLKVWDVFPAGFYIDNLVQVRKSLKHALELCILSDFVCR